MQYRAYDVSTSYIYLFHRVKTPVNLRLLFFLKTSVSQPPGRGPVPGPGVNYTGPREVLLELVILQVF